MTTINTKYQLIGQRFGRLTVVSFYGKERNQRQWLCQCDCGQKKILTTAILNYGAVKSCGCLRNEKLINRSKKHGYSKRGEVHPLYSVRVAFLNRCHNPKDRFYSDYGGRGISVCEEWIKNPKSFIEWAFQNGWKKGLSIDRKDNNKGYSPDNCRFVTQEKQNANTRKSIHLKYKNKTRPIAEWARLFELKRDTLYCRIKIHNWSIEKALLTPVSKL